MFRNRSGVIYGTFFSIAMALTCASAYAQPFDENNIPLPEHPRPDFQRSQWVNLNGPWQFQFDPENIGLQEKWQNSDKDFAQAIMVPFPWGSKLSGVKDEAHIAWYKREIEIPESWNGELVYLVIGACDWHTTAWLDGQPLGEHQGGYTPFEFDLTPHINGDTAELVLRVDDTPHDFKLEGKQGYGRAAGIWQTVYLETRPKTHFDYIHFTPDINNEQVKVTVGLNRAAPQNTPIEFQFKNNAISDPVLERSLSAGAQEETFDIQIKNPRLWSLEDPHLYEVDAILNSGDEEDRISTYFGMREIGVVNMPGTDYSYVALNGKPVYLQMALDQAYHPDGYYTFPSDEFMRNEILRSRQIGLNGQRIHIKIEVPRKLYWADRLGVLIMEDVPNFWGQPTEEARQEWEHALRGMIKRDYNHPSIFSWCNFNETWGLFTAENWRDEENREYLPETQEWVASMYHLSKDLDPTRLVEDNSPCNFDHVVTDLNSWHAYLPGYRWREVLDEYCEKTFPGSEWNYIGGRKQGNEPMFNSECGNVWGYEGSTGDVDWSWDYHIMINEFRRHPKCSGWLYTEHHDVINEWNGYWRYDRSEKFTGMDELVHGMDLNDLHSKFYLASERELCRQVEPGETVDVPMYLSIMTGNVPGEELVLRANLYGWNTLGEQETFSSFETTIPCAPWMNQALDPLPVEMPDKPALAVLSLVLEDSAGAVLHRNFTTYVVGGESPREEMISRDKAKLKVLRIAPEYFSDQSWSLKQWDVLDGLKVNGAGHGYFEYRLDWPDDLNIGEIEAASFRIEVSAKKLHGKDASDLGRGEGDFMRGRGTHDPSSNKNSYPMTDEEHFPSHVEVHVGGESIGLFDLRDDPADHRGILSWFSQKRDRRLREAGSYGYLIAPQIPEDLLRRSAEAGEIVVRLDVSDALPGGLAIYGERFGRYPLDPSLVFQLKD